MAIAAAICGVIAFGIYGQVAESHALDGQAAQLTQQNAALQQQISERQREIVEAQTSAWLEEQARKLGYVYPWERVFVLLGPGSAPAARGGVAAPLPSFSPLPTPSASTGPSPSLTPRPSPTALPLRVPSPSPTPTSR